MIKKLWKEEFSYRLSRVSRDLDTLANDIHELYDFVENIDDKEMQERFENTLERNGTDMILTFLSSYYKVYTNQAGVN